VKAFGPGMKISSNPDPDCITALLAKPTNEQNVWISKPDMSVSIVAQS
jgi:hypothetical protein